MTEEFKEYSIWLLPPPEIHNKLCGLVTELSRKYSGPIFEPHITLVGDVLETYDGMASKCKQLSKILSSFKISFETYDYYTEFYKCVFITIKKTSEVLDIFSKAYDVFGISTRGPVLPHVSLLYGFYDEKEKQKVISELCPDYLTEFEISSFHMVLSSSSR